MTKTEHSPLAVVEEYELKVRLLTEHSPFECDAWITLKNENPDGIEKVTFYIHPELEIATVKDAQKNVLPIETELVIYPHSYTSTARKIEITLSNPLPSNKQERLNFCYHGWFNRSQVRSRSDYMRIDTEGTYLRGFGYSLWFPVVTRHHTDYNLSAKFKLDLDIPKDWRPLAFGNLLSETVQSERNHSVWKTPEPVRLSMVQLSAAPWQVIGTDQLKIYHLPSPESEKAAKTYADIGTYLVDFFDKHYGAGLPKQTFYFAEMDIRGGISSGNIAALPSEGFKRILNPERQFSTYDWMGHEIIHPYVMPAIVPDAPGATMMVEPFPLYFHLPALQKRFGRPFERWFLRGRWEAYKKGLAAQSLKDRGGLPLEKPLLDISLEELSAYKDIFLLSDKAVLILHRLQKEVGETTFLNAVSKFLRSHRTIPATLKDFEHKITEESGTSFEGFFQRWFGTTEPLPEAWRIDDTAEELS